MIIQMNLNGNDILSYGLVATKGTLEAILTPASDKGIVTNENSAIDGSIMYAAPSMRRVTAKDITLPFLVRPKSILDLRRVRDELIRIFQNGKNNTGVNELYVPLTDETFRLVFRRMSKITPIGLEGHAILTVQFTEPNPNNRQ